jgi:molybdopterin-containing oxidoreductase family membrane subunit
MIEKALKGGRGYWMTVAVLGGIAFLGALFYLQQLNYGLGITGLSRDVTWGFYIAQFTFLVGVAASAVMVVLPYYLHNYKAFGKITILGEFLAVASVAMCVMFILVDLGQPARSVNIVRYPSPKSILFWDTIVLNGYLLLNIIIAWTSLDAERKSIAPPPWIKILILVSIPWAVSIHTVTAFIYNGLAARGFWLTAILAPRFLASAFCSGPALLIILCLILKKFTRFDAGREPIQSLAKIVTYALIINVFFVLLEIFTVFYSQIPEHMHHFEYLLFGYEGHSTLVPWIWTSFALAAVAIILLISPRFRAQEGILAIACACVFLSTWIDKGLGMVVTGFVPSPTGTITDYSPTIPEVMITFGVYAIGFLILTVLYKIALTVRDRVAA